MNKQTYRIIGSTLTIPGIPGEFHAGQEVDVDADTMTVLATRLIDAPEPGPVEQSKEEEQATVLNARKAQPLVYKAGQE